jgi:Capsular polysaccharide synthesis protein
VIGWLRRRLRGLKAPQPRERPAELPRTIWMLWLQGWDEAPELVGACVRTWRRCNPGWELRLLTENDLPALIGDDAVMRTIGGRQLPPEAFSDVVRLALLLRYGGVWADATTYCLRPLDDWLPPMLASGFFAFTNFEPDRMIASWFLAAEPGSRLLQIWQAYVVAYWRRRERPHTYFWFHGFLFRRAYRENREFRAIWKATPTVSSRGPAQVASRLGDPLPEAQWAAIRQSGVPLLKLRHRRGDTPFGPQSAYRMLVDLAGGDDGCP